MNSITLLKNTYPHDKYAIYTIIPNDPIKINTELNSNA